MILRENYNEEKVDEILKNVNGAIIPGGDIDLVDGGYDIISEKIYNYAIQQKRRGVIWPVLGESKTIISRLKYIYHI